MLGQDNVVVIAPGSAVVALDSTGCCMGMECWVGGKGVVVGVVHTGHMVVPLHTPGVFDSTAYCQFAAGDIVVVGSNSLADGVLARLGVHPENCCGSPVATDPLGAHCMHKQQCHSKLADSCVAAAHLYVL